MANNFTIDPEDLIKDRITNRLAIEQGLPNTGAMLEATNPTTTAMPNATAAAQGIATPEQVQYTMSQLQQRFPTVEGGPGAQVPVDIGAEISGNPEAAMVKRGIPPKIAKELAKHINDNGPPKLIGKDILNTGRGGIFGLGIEPIDVLAFALGAAVTSRLPQDQAIATTFKIAGMPRQFKEARQKAGADLINQLVSGEGIAQTNQRTAIQQKELDIKNEKQTALNSWVTRWTDRLSNGVPTTGIEQQAMAAEAIRAGIPHESIKQFLVKPITEQLAELRTIQGMPGGEGIRADITSPSGVKYRIGGTSGEKTINPGEVKLYADIGIKGPSIPAEMTRDQARLAVEAQQTRDVQLTGQKAQATSQNTPLSGEAANVINVGEDVKRQLQIIKDTFDDMKDPKTGKITKGGRDVMGPIKGMDIYQNSILPRTQLTNRQQQFIQAYNRLARWSQQQFTGAAAGVEEMKKILGTLPQLINQEGAFKAGVEKSLTDANDFVKRYGQMVTTPKSETGKQFKDQSGYKKVED